MVMFVQIQSVIVIENQRMIASCQLMRKKPHNNSCEIHTDEKDVQSNNALIHKESNEP